MAHLNRYEKHATARLDDGTAWMLPLARPDADEIEWLLRYGNEAQVLEQRLYAAEIIGTFRALIFDGTTERAVERLRELRRLVREP